MDTQAISELTSSGTRYSGPCLDIQQVNEKVSFVLWLILAQTPREISVLELSEDDSFFCREPPKLFTFLKGRESRGVER